MSNDNVPRYQDFVIKDGVLIGDFEGLYKTFEDPWFQSKSEHAHDTRRQIALSWLSRLKERGSVSRVVELGCGFGHFTETLRQAGFTSLGIDISETAIDRAKSINPEANFLQGVFSDFSSLEKFQPDAIVMAEITWYVLDDLDEFLARLRRYAASRDRPTYLIHLLATYPEGVQKYGLNKFTDLKGVLRYFDLKYLESGHILTPSKEDPDAQGTYFVAQV